MCKEFLTARTVIRRLNHRSGKTSIPIKNDNSVSLSTKLICYTPAGLVVGAIRTKGGRTVRTITRLKGRLRVSGAGLVFGGLLCLGLASCQSQSQPACRVEAPITPRAETNLNPGWPQANQQFQQVSYQEVRAVVPKLQGAEYVNDDEFCATCHGAYAKTFVTTMSTAATAANRATVRPAATWKPAARSRG